MTDFNIEHAISSWKRELRKNKEFDDGHVEELEVHLRDHIEDLVSDGVSEQVAFATAIAEFGGIEKVAKLEAINVRPATWVPLFFFRNYVKIAFRSYTKQPFTSLLNTFGLSIGLAGALLIGLFINDELNFNTSFKDANRIFRVNIDNQTNGEYSEYASAPGPMAGVIAADFPHAEQVTRFREVGSVLVRHADSTLNIKEPYVVAADSSMFEMFDLKLLTGNTSTALKKPNSVVLTKSVSNRLFADMPAVGQSIILDNKDVYVVTGILDDLPSNTFLRNHSMFLSLKSFEDENTIAWNTWYFPTFVKLYPSATQTDLQDFLTTVNEQYLIPWAMTFIPGLTIEKARQMSEETGNFMRFNSIALTDIHLHSKDREGEFSENGDIQNLYILGIIAGFLILMACVNFMNLSTATSLQRAKEVGVRKTLGSSRFDLIRQFLTEALLTSMVSMLIAVFLAMIAIPFFNLLADKQLEVPINSIPFWLLLTGITLALGFLSGLYPSILLSQFSPARALKTEKNVGGRSFRNGLVILQFSVSVFLIIGTLVVYQQVDFIRTKDLGFQKDQMLVIEDVDAAGNQMVSFKNEVSKLSMVENVSLSSYLPTPSDRSGTTFFSEGSFVDGDLNTDQALIIEHWEVDESYVSTLGMEIIEGRNFSQSPADTNSIILNETALSMLNVNPEDAIGLRLTNDFHRDDKENMRYLTIIGVVKNFHFENMRNRIDAVSFSKSTRASKMIVRLHAGDFGASIEKVGDIWSTIAPGQPFQYYFMDDSFNDTYHSDLRLGKIFIVFTQLSVLIACLGLFGLVTFAAEKRTKEIGIKKVLGASIRQITFQLSTDFLKPVIVAIVIALPVGWYIMNLWLEEFAFRIEISGWILASSAIIALLVTIITVSYQSIRAAIVNPVKSLRSE